MSRLRDACAGGWVAAVPFVFLGAPERWQFLALIMGSLIAWVYARPTKPLVTP